METVTLIGLFVLGAIVGSFLNVVIYRFNTGRSFGGRSHCLSCGHQLTWYELIPVVSFLLQRGRCRRCTSRISVRYCVVELATAALFVLAGVAFFPDSFSIGVALAALSLLMVIAVYDIRHTIIPDSLVVALCVVAVIWVGVWAHAERGAVVLPVVASFIPAAFLGFLWLLSRGRWIGLGDAKLAVPLGLLVVPVSGTLGSISMLMLSFWVGALYALGALAMQRLLGGKHSLRFFGHQLTMKSEVPFAPFLVVGFLLVFLGDVDAIALIGALIYGH